MHIKSYGGAQYFLLLKDDFSHYRIVYFLKQKSEVADRIKEFVTQTHVQTKHRIKVIQSDNGTEFVTKAFRYRNRSCFRYRNGQSASVA